MSTLKVVNFVHGFLITVSTLGYEEKRISRLPKKYHVEERVDCRI